MLSTKKNLQLQLHPMIQLTKLKKFSNRRESKGKEEFKVIKFLKLLLFELSWKYLLKYFSLLSFIRADNKFL